MKTKIDSKIGAYFSKITLKLSTPPSKHLVHLYADYVEVISLFSNSNFVTASDIADRFKDEGIITKKKEDSEQAEGNDMNEQWINDIFFVLEERTFLYKSDYPFELHGNSRIKLIQQSNLTNRHKLYIFLLLSSCLYQFGDFEPELTSEFEFVCYQVLLKYMPSHAVVKSFGKNSEYSGTAIEKIRLLAKELKVGVNDNFLNKISTRGNQERGLDLIGWVPFDDNVANHFSILSQCACGKEWYKKLGETRRYENYYDFYCAKPLHAFFIPYSLINYQNSDFYQADEISIPTLLFERKRILNYITDTSFFGALSSKQLVDKCIEYEEDII